MQAVVSVLIATFVGFGAAMCGCSFLFEILRWRRIWQGRSNTQASAVRGVSAPTSEIGSLAQASPSEPEILANIPSSHGD